MAFNPENRQLGGGLLPRQAAPPPPAQNDFVSPSQIPQSAPRGGRQLNPRQQARADALAALTPQQIANRARRQAAGAGQPPTNQPGGDLMQPPGPTTQHPVNPGGGGSFVQPEPPPGGGMMGGGLGQPPMGAYPPQGGGQGGRGGGGQQSNYNPMTDPWKLWEQAVPVMNLNRDKQIGDSMATAGFGGNRYGTYAAGKAAEIGAENSLSQDALLGQLLSSFANNQEDRSLQGTKLGLDSAALQEQMTQSRMMLPFQMGQYEQGRQDNFSNTAYQDFNQNRLGWLGLLLNSANQQGAGSPGQVYTTQTPGSPGAAGYADFIRAIFGGG